MADETGLPPLNITVDCLSGCVIANDCPIHGTRGGDADDGSSNRLSGESLPIRERDTSNATVPPDVSRGPTCGVCGKPWDDTHGYTPGECVPEQVQDIPIEAHANLNQDAAIVQATPAEVVERLEELSGFPISDWRDMDAGCAVEDAIAAIKRLEEEWVRLADLYDTVKKREIGHRKALEEIRDGGCDNLETEGGKHFITCQDGLREREDWCPSCLATQALHTEPTDSQECEPSRTTTRALEEEK